MYHKRSVETELNLLVGNADKPIQPVWLYSEFRGPWFRPVPLSTINDRPKRLLASHKKCFRFVQLPQFLAARHDFKILRVLSLPLAFVFQVCATYNSYSSH